MKGIIYARVSSSAESDRQNTLRQIEDLTSYADKNQVEVVQTFEEYVSGAKKLEERHVFSKALKFAKEEGIDIILFNELSRCGRSIVEVSKTINYLVDNNINAFFQKENLYIMQDGKINPITYVILSCLSMCAELERENIKFRLNSGRELAKKNNVKMGRKVGSTKSKAQKREEYAEVIKLLKKGLSVANVVAICKTKNVKASTSTVKRIKKEFLGTV